MLPLSLKILPHFVPHFPAVLKTVCKLFVIYLDFLCSINLYSLISFFYLLQRLLGNKMNPKQGARSSFAMIGYKGSGKFSWIQYIGKRPGRGPSAISTSISMFSGV